MDTVAVGIICKTPLPGRSKTRLSPPLRPEECAAISACFIRDLSRTIGLATRESGATGYGVYTPRGSESTLQRLLPSTFALVPQAEGHFGTRLHQGICDLLQEGHRGAILINSDSPTLPQSIIRSALDAVRNGDNVVLSPALDGGYTLIGLSRPHPRLFEDIAWSTATVYERTLDRAREIGLPVVDVPGWYDVDDEASLRMLEDEISGQTPARLPTAGADAPATRRFLRERQIALVEPV